MFSLRQAALRAGSSRPLHLALLPVAPVAAAPLGRPLALTLARSFAAASAPSTDRPRSLPPKKRVRSLAEIEADRQRLRLASSGGRWTPTTEPGEKEQLVVFQRPLQRPLWFWFLIATIVTTACFEIAWSMLDLTKKEVVDQLPETKLVEEDPLQSTSTEPSAAPSHSTLATVTSSLPFKLPSVTNNWAIGMFALAAVPPLVVLYFANKSCARIIQYRPSGRLRVYTHLTDSLGKGKLIDFGIAESALTRGSRKADVQLLTLHLPPLGLDPDDPKASLKFPTVKANMEPLSADELDKLRAAGQNVTVDIDLMDRAFNGFLIKAKPKSKPKE